MYPLITKDPVTGEPLVVTRLEGPSTGIAIEGRFSLGWIGQLTPEQLEFVGVMVRNRGNLQKVASDTGVSYNTARNRMDEIAAAFEGAHAPPAAPPTAPPATTAQQQTLSRLAAGEISFDDALRAIRGE